MKLAILILAALIEIYPNPYGSDEAEYVKFQCSSECILSDGEGFVKAGEGLHIATKNLSYFQQRFGYSANIQFSRSMALSNSGEQVCVEDSEGKDCFYYGKDLAFLDEGVIYYRTENGWDFRYEDWSNFSCLEETLEGELIITPADFFLDDGWTVASYTFHAPFNPEKLYVDARTEIPCREVELNATFLSAPSYRNFHYKFAVKQNKVVITTENWQFNKRGFILVFENQNISSTLLNLLRNDEKYSTYLTKSCSDWTYVKVKGEGKRLSFRAPAKFFILPDCNPILNLISSSKERLYIIAPYIDFRWYEGNRFLESVIAAKNNGAEVVVFLNPEYVRSDALDVLREEGVEVRFVEKLHGKAIISDDKILVTSANMNMYGLKLNREVGVIIYSKDVADFVAEEFYSLQKPSPQKPSPLDLAIVLIAFLTAVAIFRRAKDKGKG